MPYTVVIPNHAKKQIRAVPKQDATRILDALERFANDMDFPSMT